MSITAFAKLCAAKPKRKKGEFMILTQKEISLLSDLSSQEKLCIEKYGKYAQSANDPALKQLFESLRATEQKHLDTLTQMQSGTEVEMPPAPSATESKTACTPSSVSPEQKQSDAFLCKDALSMEKHVSSVYNTSTFEFKSPVMRDTLAHIQKEEQNHGERLYSYMECNGMYN